MCGTHGIHGLGQDAFGLVACGITEDLGWEVSVWSEETVLCVTLCASDSFSCLNCFMSPSTCGKCNQTTTWLWSSSEMSTVERTKSLKWRGVDLPEWEGESWWGVRDMVGGDCE